MTINRVLRSIRRIYCRHKNTVFLREDSPEPRGGAYPVRCCLDCGKLDWANVTLLGKSRYVEYWVHHPLWVRGGA